MNNETMIENGWEWERVLGTWPSQVRWQHNIPCLEGYDKDHSAAYTVTLNEDDHGTWSVGWWHGNRGYNIDNFKRCATREEAMRDAQAHLGRLIVGLAVCNGTGKATACPNNCAEKQGKQPVEACPVCTPAMYEGLQKLRPIHGQPAPKPTETTREEQLRVALRELMERLGGYRHDWDNLSPIAKAFDRVEAALSTPAAEPKAEPVCEEGGDA